MASLPGWDEQMRGLEGVVDRLNAKWRPDGPTPAEVQDMTKLALACLASGYLCRVYTDKRRPAFMPLWNYAVNQGGPVPDYVYTNTEVDGDGVYRITGFRGTNRFTEVTQGVEEIMAPSTLAGAQHVPNTNDLDQLTLGDDGYFSVILSNERPEGYDGDWWELHPRARRLLVRTCACDWKHEVDSRMSIERLDDGGADMTPEEIASRISDMALWVEGMIEFDMNLTRHYRSAHGINTIKRSAFMDGGGGVPDQVYYDGVHEIDESEALILETELPRESRYWQILVSDDRFCTVDWVNRLSSYNDITAQVSSDGKFRAVISTRDPGVPNWLDKADYPWGVIQMRWNKASDAPDPELKKVPFAEVRQHLPADTPVVSPEERAAQLRERREGALLRRIW